MTHHRTIIKCLAATAAAAAFVGAGAQAQGSPLGRAHAGAAGIPWSATQLNQLAKAYAKKNPGWVAPEAVTATTPAQLTWTPQALDALAAAYAAKNPGWVRP